jgi:hypothetical protein
VLSVMGFLMLLHTLFAFAAMLTVFLIFSCFLWYAHNFLMLSHTLFAFAAMFMGFLIFDLKSN